GEPAPAESGAATVEPTIRKNFADTALWVANLDTNNDGVAEVELAMPENLTTWKTQVWTMGSGTRVGQGSADVVTYKDLIVRLQAPRFFVQKDEVVLSANVHNYLKTKKTVKVVLDIDNRDGGLWPFAAAVPADTRTFPQQYQTIELAPNTDKRVDWRVTAVRP